MNIELTDLAIIAHLQHQAKVQGKEPAALLQELYKKCAELKLVESLGSATSSEQWGQLPL